MKLEAGLKLCRVKATIFKKILSPFPDEVFPDKVYRFTNFVIVSLEKQGLLANYYNSFRAKYRRSLPDVFSKKGVLRNFAKFTGKRLCFHRLTKVFFCEFCEISKNTFLHRTPPVAAFENRNSFIWFYLFNY